MTLEQIRDEIDAIDAEMVKLLDRRARAGKEVAAVKHGAGLALRNLKRENEVVARALSLSDGSMPAHSVENIIRAVMRETLALETAQPGPAEPCAGPAAGKRDVAAEVAENAAVAPGFYRMRLYVPQLAGAFAPGQFFQIQFAPETGGLFLRRPFAPSETDDDGFSFVYAVVGRGTRAMAEIPIGAGVKVLAPLGNAYTPPPSGATALLIGGGCGGPSLAPLARSLKTTGVRTTVLIGARTSSMLLEHRTFAKIADRLILATDDGSLGCKGTALDAFHLENLDKPDRIYACGPLPMLRAAAALAERLDVACQVSLEERMACGFGACMGCAVPVKTGDGSVFRRVCHDGPVFDSRLLDWEAMVRA